MNVTVPLVGIGVGWYVGRQDGKGVGEGLVVGIEKIIVGGNELEQRENKTRRTAKRRRKGKLFILIVWVKVQDCRN